LSVKIFVAVKVAMAAHATAGLMSRRELLLTGGGLTIASFGAGHLTAANHAGIGKARSCILVYLLGGPPHLDMFDLKPAAPAEIRGPFRPIATTVPGLQICEHLPRLAQRARHYALVRSVSHSNHNHTPMIYYTLTGRQVERPGEDNDVRPPQRSDSPHLGSVLARHLPAPRGLPGYVAIPELATRSSIEGQYRRVRQLLRGGAGGFLGPLVDPLSVHGDPGQADAIPALRLPAEVSHARLQRRDALLDLLEQRGSTSPGSRTHAALRQQAVALTGASRGAAAVFALDAEPGTVRERYGRHRFGRAMLLARRLAEAGVPMVAIHFNEMTMCDGWDTHSKNFEALQTELLPMVDQSLSALLDDLQQRGLFDETLVVMMGEFGRTPRINGDAGRDHWGSCQSVLLAGGGIRGGQVHGASDRIAAYPATDPVDPVDVHATMFHCMGLHPEQQVLDNLQRPHPLTTGRVIGSLI
jgi:hypothetical protein